MTATGIPNPIPIFAPVDNPPGLGPGSGVGEVVPDVVAVVDGCVVIDGCVVVAEVGDAVNAFRSELCHHTGIPSPNIVYPPVGTATVSVLRVPAVVYWLSPFKVGKM